MDYGLILPSLGDAASAEGVEAAADAIELLMELTAEQAQARINAS